MRKILTYGTFDLFHIGHLNILKRARDLGGHLTVAISTDEFNWSAKSKVCVVPYRDRSEVLANLRCVDRVIPETDWDQKRADVKQFGIDTFVMGDDWAGKFDFLSDLCEVVYLPRTENISTSELKAYIKETPSNSVIPFNRTARNVQAVG